MKQATLIGILILLSHFANSQLKNYDSNGHKWKIQVEKIIILLDTAKEEKQAAIGFTTILGNIVGVGAGLVQSHLTAKQESYSATYTGKVVSSRMMKNNAILSPNKLKIYRLTWNEKHSIDTAAIIILSFVQDRSVFRLETDQIEIRYAKARIKKGGSIGKAIELNIDIKIDAMWYNYELDSSGKKAKSATLESATLGQSSIYCSNIKPGKVDPEKRSSDWFKMVPQDSKGISSELNGRGWYSITVTIKEANPYGITSKKIADYFKENNAGITTFFKGFIPGNSDETKTE